MEQCLLVTVCVTLKYYSCNESDSNDQDFVVVPFSLINGTQVQVLLCHTLYMHVTIALHCIMDIQNIQTFMSIWPPSINKLIPIRGTCTEYCEDKKVCM